MFGLKIIKISGHSMEPALKAGSYVLGWDRLENLKIGDVVLFRIPGYLPMLKRIVMISDDSYYLYGDNPSDSLDSRKFGPVKRKYITHKIIYGQK